MGLIVNKPSRDVGIDDVLGQLEIEPSPACPALPVHFGGPVEGGRGFVLHSSDYEVPGTTVTVSPTLRMTATLEVVQDLAAGDGPDRAMLALGYSGWAPGQLEEEFATNGWLLAPPREDILFGHEDDRKWSEALGVIGVNPLALSSEMGHA